MLERIVRYDLLASYARVDGVERALNRIRPYLDSRWRKQFALERGVEDLLAHEAAFAADFHEFFRPCRLTSTICSNHDPGLTRGAALRHTLCLGSHCLGKYFMATSITRSGLSLGGEHRLSVETRPCPDA